MRGFSGKPKRIFNFSFASEPILVQGFAYSMVQYLVAGARMNEEKTIHKFLNKEKDKKIYDVWVDRYITVGF